ncbi:MAG: BrnT family toxin [Terracidiphilus sp.]
MEEPVKIGPLHAGLFCNTMCIYKVRYEWDERKNRENQRRHDGISFELASLVFEDERCLVGVDRVDETGEQRWHAIGAVSIEPEIAAVLVVAHVYREIGHGEEVVRILSARRAEKHEYRRYQEQAMD